MKTSRYTEEQMSADQRLIEFNEKSIKDWKHELVTVEHDLIQEAIKREYFETKKDRELALEQREENLRRFIEEAERKLASVYDRYNRNPVQTQAIMMESRLNNNLTQ